MGLRVDKERAEQILREEAANAAPPPERWCKLVSELSAVCEEVGARTHVAFLGTALLAKATDHRIDPFSIKATSRRPGAYSARGVAEEALAPVARELGIHLGVTSRQPLNNQPYFRSVEVSSEMTVRGSARRALEAAMSVLAELSRLGTEQEARDALRAFIAVRRMYCPQYPEADPGPLGRPLDEFIGEVERFVMAASEAGRRAQAVAAGILMARFGRNQVVAQRIHDPDRSLPGDVGVRAAAGGWRMVVEVRDKLVKTHDVRAFLDKSLEASLMRAAVLAVAEGQTTVDVSAIGTHASTAGIIFRLFVGWDPFIREVLTWSRGTLPELLDATHREVALCLEEIEASVDAAREWQAIRRPTGSM